MADTISIRVKRELRARLGGLARMNGLTVSQFVRQHLAQVSELPAESAAAPKKNEEATTMTAPKYPEPTDEPVTLHRPCPFYIEQTPGWAAVYCKAKNPRLLLCTRNPGHAGPHIAHGTSPYGRFAVWNEEARP